MRSFVAENEAACTLVNVLPTTMAGVIVLLRYTVDADGWRGMANRGAIGRGQDPIVASFPGCQFGRNATLAVQRMRLIRLMLARCRSVPAVAGKTRLATSA